MTQQLPVRTDPPHYEFRWEQDSHRRIVKLSGVIDATAASHLESAIINLGSRRLVVDVSEASALDPTAASILLDMARRLGPGRVSVAVDPDDESGLVLTDIAEVEVLRYPA